MLMKSRETQLNYILQLTCFVLYFEAREANNADLAQDLQPNPSYWFQIRRGERKYLWPFQPL